MSDWKRYNTGRTPREGESRPTAKGWYHTYHNGAKHSESRYFDGVMFENITTDIGQPDWWREADIPSPEDNHGFHRGMLPNEPGWYLGWDEDLSVPHAFKHDNIMTYWRHVRIENRQVRYVSNSPRWWKKDILPELPELFQQNN